MIERDKLIEMMGREHDPIGWDWYDHAADDHPAKPIFLKDQMKRNGAALDCLLLILNYPKISDDLERLREFNNRQLRLQMEARQNWDYWQTAFNNPLFPHRIGLK